MKVLVADFDKTLFDENYIKNIESIKQFTDEGNVFVIATGRHKDLLIKDIKDYNITYSYLICNDGAIIFDKEMNALYKKDIPKQTAIDILDILNKSKFVSEPGIYTGFDITNNIDGDVNGIYAKFSNRKEASKLLDIIRQKHDNIDAYLSIEWINIIEKEVSKGRSIKYLADKLGIDGNNVYTIGDGINDLSMSDYNFNSYAMEVGIDKLKKVTKGTYHALYQLVEDIRKD